ncbi:MAG TPA: F0F1 ATP synthase subunit epsilon [Methylomirabilota bacterium]|nr:F0F1 ATP synthase subunit epsilon [Methylomirabilota bacterium]
MNTFRMHLQSATQYERIEDVISFVGEDDSGSFGILAGHARMMTLLAFGLARFRVLNEDWEFLALPAALAYFVDGELYLSTRRYLRGRDFEGLSIALRHELLAEEQALNLIKQSVRRLEEEMFKRLWKVKPSGESSG